MDTLSLLVLVVAVSAVFPSAAAALDSPPGLCNLKPDPGSCNRHQNNWSYYYDPRTVREGTGIFLVASITTESLTV